MGRRSNSYIRKLYNIRLQRCVWTDEGMNEWRRVSEKGVEGMRIDCRVNGRNVD